MILYKTTLNEAMLMEGDCDDDAGVDHDNDDVDKRDGDHWLAIVLTFGVGFWWWVFGVVVILIERHKIGHMRISTFLLSGWNQNQ